MEACRWLRPSGSLKARSIPTYDKVPNWVLLKALGRLPA
jgi:hypothetical protein